MAGKTATNYTGGVMNGESTGGKQKTDVASFVGFAPAHEPKIEIYVSVFEPSDPTGAHGSTHAVPIFSRLTDAILKHLKVEPDLK
jgi:cell division protein FtsI/penicillin-binding protein 2